MTSQTPSTIDSLVSTLADGLIQRGWYVTAAESCTGGGVAQAFTGLAGSSSWFEAGFVVYSNRIKHDVLDVSFDTLRKYGAVSEQVVEQMVRGALLRTGADIGVAISGIAGPEGGTPEKPVGTVWFAWALAGGAVHTERCRFSGDRKSVQRLSVEKSISGLVSLLEKTPV